MQDRWGENGENPDFALYGCKLSNNGLLTSAHEHQFGCHNMKENPAPSPYLLRSGTGSGFGFCNAKLRKKQKCPCSGRGGVNGKACSQRPHSGRGRRRAHARSDGKGAGARRHLVETCADGLRALTLLEENVYDLIIADIRMPKYDGMELLGTVRKQYPNTTFIMMTAFGTIDSAVEAMKLGAFDYISKPFKKELVAKSIRHSPRPRTDTPRPRPCADTPGGRDRFRVFAAGGGCERRCCRCRVCCPGPRESQAAHRA